MPNPTNHINHEEQRLEEIANVEYEPLFTFQTVFPFDFFPDTVTIYRNKLTICERRFFILEDTTSIPIANINYIRVLSAFPFATLEITDRFFSEEPVFIRKLHLRDAEKAMRIIDGLRLATKQNIDTTKIPKAELLENIQKIGVMTS